ncbi:MAG: DUF3347 domain-containing protein [Acidobacteriota bacterium]
MKTTFYTFLILSFTVTAWAGTADAEIEKILDQYFQIHAALAQDSTEGVDVAAREIISVASEAPATDSGVQKLFDDVKKAAQQIQGKNLDEARAAFFELSKPISAYLSNHYSGNKKYPVYFCSMSQKSWIQAEKGVRNPYYGSSMLTCGTLAQ